MPNEHLNPPARTGLALAAAALLAVAPPLARASSQELGLQADIYQPINAILPQVIQSVVTGVLNARTSFRSLVGESPQERGIAAAAAGDRWNGWLSWAHNRVGIGYFPIRSGGHVDAAVGGVDYTLNNGAVVGVALSIDRSLIKTNFNGGSVNGEGLSVAPYVAWPLGKAWLLDASVGFGRSDQDIRNGGCPANNCANFKDKRSFGSGGISYVYESGRLQLTGRGTLLFTDDRNGPFTSTIGGFFPGTVTRVLQARIGGQAAYEVGAITPYAGLYYVGDLHRANILQVAGSPPPSNDRDGIQLQAGFNFNSRGKISGGVMVSTEFDRRQARNDQFMANISISF